MRRWSDGMLSFRRRYGAAQPLNKHQDCEMHYVNRRAVMARGLTVLSAGALAGGSAAFSPVLADINYPKSPIRLIVPRSAGGVLDIIARDWTRCRSESRRRSRRKYGGGGGMTGTVMVAHATADGYTLLLGSTSDLVLNPALSIEKLYDPVKDFSAISGLAISVAMIMVNPAVPAHNLIELVSYAKKQSRQTVLWLSGRRHIPYKGAAPGYADLIAGTIPIMSTNITGTVLEMHKAGQVRILAVATDHRLSAAPDIETTAEAGYPDLIAQLFVGLFAPAGTPKPIIDRLAKVTVEVIADKDFENKLQAAGFEPVVDFGPDRTTRYFAEEQVRWLPILKESGLKPG
jgi:tripartite-type tricarboxylate transporter receptor subunit TctC